MKLALNVPWWAQMNDTVIDLNLSDNVLFKDRSGMDGWLETKLHNDVVID